MNVWLAVSIATFAGILLGFAVGYVAGFARSAKLARLMIAPLREKAQAYDSVVADTVERMDG